MKDFLRDICLYSIYFSSTCKTHIHWTWSAIVYFLLVVKSYCLVRVFCLITKPVICLITVFSMH